MSTALLDRLRARLPRRPPLTAVAWASLTDLDRSSRTRARVTGQHPAVGLDPAALPRGWALVRVRYRTRDDVRTVPPILRTFTETNAVFPDKLRFSAKRGDRFERILFVADDLTEAALELHGAVGFVDLDGPEARPIGRSRAMAAMLWAQVVAFVKGENPRRDTIARAWGHLREGGVRGLRRQMVDRYGSLQDRRGMGTAERTISYAQWRSLYASPDADDLEALRARTEALADKPTISVVVPVYDTPERWLRRAIESVRAQTYPHWQLCLANDASPSPHVRAVLDGYAATDPRIRVVHRDVNGHIAAASNSALGLATGRWVALLDHDDELAPFALAVVALHLAEHPGQRLVYSDEDKLDERGKHVDPFFKPDWNPELLESQNYIGHLVVARRDLVETVGGFRVGFEGSQDYDLLLRMTERLDPAEIGHLPHVLYHWRSIAGSTARATGEKSYAEDAGVRAVQEHLDRTGRQAIAEVGAAPTTYHVRYRLDRPPLVSIVVPTRDQGDLLRTCIESVRERSAYPAIELIVVDNQSTDPATVAYLAELDTRDGTRVIHYDAPFNYAAINNTAVAASAGELVLLLNNDTEVITPGWLEEMVGLALRPQIGAVGAKLRYSDGSIQHGGVVLGIGGVAGHSHKLAEPDAYGYFSRLVCTHAIGAVTGACLLTRRQVWDELGGLDDDALAVAFNDIDYCLKLQRAGYRVVWTPWAELFHHESKSRGHDDTPEKARRFQAEVLTMLGRWGDALEHDPSFNPNLSLDHEQFSIAEVPRVRLPWL